MIPENYMKLANVAFPELKKSFVHQEHYQGQESELLKRIVKRPQPWTLSYFFEDIYFD